MTQILVLSIYLEKDKFKCTLSIEGVIRMKKFLFPLDTRMAQPIIGIWPPNFADVIAPNPTFCISPIDGRYFVPEAAAYFSPYGELKAHLRLEIALVQTLHKTGICTVSQLRRIINASRRVTAEDVDAVENQKGGTQHDIDALVACIRKTLPQDTRSLVHRTATSFDIRSSGDALRNKEAVISVLLPDLVKLESILIEMVLRDVDTVQVGRTHLMDAVPITLGFGMSKHIYRLLDCIRNLIDRALALKAKFTGATGTMAAASIILDDPFAFQYNVLSYVGLKAAEYSCQTTMPEDLVRLHDEFVTLAMVLYDMANDFRILLSSAYGEFVLELDPNQTGSSAMPQKVNPKDVENVCSLARIIVGRMITPHLDQETNLQRDLRDSADFRTRGESFAYLCSMIRRLIKKLPTFVVNYARLEENLAKTGGMVLAEAYNALLAKAGHPAPHAKMKAVAKLARRDNLTLIEAAQADPELIPYFDEMDPEERLMLEDPHKYIGKAPEIARRNAHQAAQELGIHVA